MGISRRSRLGRRDFEPGCVDIDPNTDPRLFVDLPASDRRKLWPRQDSRCTFGRRGGRMRIIALFAAASICLVSQPAAGQKGPQGAAVTRVSTPLREAPSVEARAFATIPPKTSVTATSCTDGWCAVQYQNFSGHVVQVFLRFPPPAALSDQ